MPARIEAESMILELDIAQVSLSFAAGMAALANPCGAMLLPAYVAQYLSDVELRDRPIQLKLLRGLSLGSAISAGFLIVFGAILGLYMLVEPGISGYSIWIGSAFGVLLILLGVISLLRKEMITFHFMQRLAGKVQATNVDNPTSGLKFYFIYGISYALASLACTLPIFLIVIGGAFTQGAFNGAIQFGAFAMGMTLLMMALSLAVVFARSWLQRTFPKFIKEMQWFGAIILIFAGGYLIWYNLILSRILQL